MTTYARINISSNNSIGIANIQKIQDRWNNNESFSAIIGVDAGIYSDSKNKEGDIFQIQFSENGMAINFQSGYDCFQDDGEEVFKKLVDIFIGLGFEIEYAEFVNEYTEPGMEGIRWETDFSNGELSQGYFDVEAEWFISWEEFKNVEWDS